MSKERYQEIINEVYENYCKSFENQSTIEQYSFDTDPMSQLMFIGKIINDPEFSEKWGLKIEERHFSDEEQRAKCHPSTPNAWDDLKEFAKLTGNSIEDAAKSVNIPTKIITVTCNNEKIEVYE